MNGSGRHPNDKSTPSAPCVESWTLDVMIVNRHGRVIGGPTIIIEHGRHGRLVRAITVIPAEAP